ncbi:hypothetical protein IJ00_09005 [Calothrix sp. 336/3]|uniref:hypothetical protein n=1 Tax=Calothrix sp. 336/3 TaxID=1337936 RepID=UPI0004E2BA17|nr:hypothetical protein [Calothrix sp. 336/3]AKG21414.1 hypothetical protein IJ00_09005 [Calothrix sp. 336/3]
MTATDFKFKISSSRNLGWKKSKLSLSASYRKLKLTFLRLSWHLKGYGTVAGIMFLVLLSMMYLNLHELVRKSSQKV